MLERVFLYNRKMKQRRWYIKKKLLALHRDFVITILFLSIFAYLTNPFTKYSIIKDPFQILSEEGIIIPHSTGNIYLIDSLPARVLGQTKAGWHILTNQFFGGGKESKEHTLEGIIDDIHQLRFDPSEPFLISGDHFSLLYPRSLGIFYHSTLDPRTARSNEDWERRQKIYLKTLVYALETYEKANRLSTTIVPIAPRSVTLVNFFDPPSDTLFSLLYGIRTLLSEEELNAVYNFQQSDDHTYTIETTHATKEILNDYTQSLQKHFYWYVTMVTDPVTQLVRKDISLSSTKDSVKRQSSFYDNVILWKTHQLAQTLDIIDSNPSVLNSLKQQIIDQFWLEKEGYFLEELSETAKENKHYSSDWLIAVQTGFLNPSNETERKYIERSIAFIQQAKLDRPFGLSYEPEEQKSNLHWVLSLTAKDYGTKAIWSNLGMEYIKTLTTLYQQTCNYEYFNEALYQINQYKDNIIKFQGYPEVYGRDGKPYTTAFYTSVHQTGWVVSFEQARNMVEYTEKNQQKYCAIQKV